MKNLEDDKTSKKNKGLIGGEMNENVDMQEKLLKIVRMQQKLLKKMRKLL